MIQNTGSTEPNRPIASLIGRGRAFFLNALILLVVIFVTIFAGYQSGISVRKQNETSVLAQQMTEQFQYAQEDIQAGRYENAQQRLQFIIANDPTFPGVQEKLTQVLV